MRSRWIETTLGDVADVNAGNPAPKKSELDLNSDIPFVRTSDVGKIGVGYIKDSRDHIPPNINAKLKVFPAGTVLFPKSGASTYLNHRVVLKMDSAVASHLAAIKAKEGMLEDAFLFYLLQNVDARELNQDSDYPSLNLSLIKKIKILLPPLDVQRCIVTLLDESFAALERARENLTANIDNCREIKTSALEGALSQYKNVERVPLETVCHDFQYGTSSKSSKVGKVPVLRMGNLQNGVIDWNNLKYTSDWDEISKYSLNSGDVLFNRTNSVAHVGKTAIFTDSRDAIFAGYLVRVNYDRDRVHGQFLCDYLNSIEAMNYGAEVMSKSVNQANISAGKLKKYPFPLLSLNEQYKISEQIGTVREKVIKLEKQYHTQLAQVGVLSKSILQHALTGALMKVSPTIALNDNQIDERFSTATLVLAYEKHQLTQRHNTFGHVKAQKTLHLAEAISGLDLGRQPRVRQAGPHDQEHFDRVEAWASQNEIFSFVRRPTGKRGYDFIRGKNYAAFLTEAKTLLADYQADLSLFLPLITQMNSEEAEVFTTIHAAWNNLLANGKTPSDEEIVWAAREGWHESKTNIARQKFFDAIRIIRRENLEPDGTAKYVHGAQESLF